MIVMMICHYDDTNSSGGLDQQARLLSRALRAVGEDVVVLASTRKRANAGWSTDEGVPVRLFWTYASPQASGRYLPAALIWAAQLLVWVIANRARIAVIHGHQMRIHAFVAALARRLFKIPTILKSALGGAGSDIYAIGTRKYLGAPGRRFVIRNTDCFVATTETIRSDLLAYHVPAERIRLIPNGTIIPTTNDAAPDARRARKCLYLGRFSREKNVAALARAAARVGAEGALEVDFFGRGDEEAQIDAAIRAGSGARVANNGWIADPATVLSDYGYVLLSSHIEGLSNTMIQAMSHGLVPVATRVSGCIEHLCDGETGFFFEGDDEASLARGLAAIAEVPPERWCRMSEAARRYAVENFDIAAICGAYRTLYAELAPRG